MSEVWLDAPPHAETVARTQRLAQGLETFIEKLDGGDREAIRVMRRLALQLLAEPPGDSAGPFKAWQYLINLARITQALIDVTRRAG